ncbi:MAG: hypothetical protein IJ525_04670 [Alphaproteobacteria bacterium]|nr:hypothetical protein [Alphaproteobacteria bacterium]
MNNFEIKNLQINFNQAEDALTIPAESRHCDHKCGSTTQSGRSMIEMLGVLAIIGVLSVGGIAGYSKAMTKYRINKTIEQITLIAGNIRAFWGPQKNYIGVDCDCGASGCTGQSSKDGCPIVKKAKIFPDEMITVTDGKITSITNPFGDRVLLGTTRKSGDNDNKAFYIWLSNIPEEACIELASFDWQNANAAAIQISSGIASIKGFPLPTQMTDIVNACSDAYSSGYIDFIAYFDIDSPNAYTSENLPAFAIY